MGSFVKIARTEDIPLGETRSFELRDCKIIIAHTPEGFFAFEDACTHDGAPIGNAQIQSGAFNCPRHGARFDAQTGDVLSPPAVVPLERYPLRIDDDELFVDVE